ncbi:hypothetical protein NQ317_009759 [Molorchus minor]|uniref:Uncharacterized protein n=1 Tax=Molorchus minor TaxID=1323400 RepID=A0ABQ9K427_9CUCU|nr:hypothetical protein NQ317_009759 [Molorchus minor]
MSLWGQGLYEYKAIHYLSNPQCLENFHSQVTAYYARNSPLSGFYDFTQLSIAYLRVHSLAFRIASDSFTFHNSATSFARGSSGFGALNGSFIVLAKALVTEVNHIHSEKETIELLIIWLLWSRSIL